MTRDEATEIILCEIKAFPGITRTHHDNRLRTRIRPPLRWGTLLDNLVELGKVEARLRMVEGKPVRVYFPVEDADELDLGRVGESEGIGPDGRDD